MSFPKLQRAGVEYNARGKVTKITDPVGRETVYVYGTNNIPDADPATGTGIDLLQVKQKNGAGYDLLASYTYNGQHQALTSTDSAGQATNYTYNAQGKILTITTPPRAGITENRTTTYGYDPNGYLQSITRPTTGSEGRTYDGYGRVRTSTDSTGYGVTYDYDALDRPTRVTYPDSTYTETAYARLDAGKLRDRLGRWTHVFHDALRRPVSMRDSLGRTMTLEWCTCGSLEKLVDGNNNSTRWERDVQGRVTREVRADGSETVATYESSTSRVKEVRDPKQQAVGIQYFNDNKWKQVTFSNAQVSTPPVSFTYDPTYDRLVTMTQGTDTTSYGYYAITTPPSPGAGRLASVDGPLPNDTITYTYDELGREVGRAVNGVGLTRTLDSLGRVSAETNPLGSFAYGYVGTTPRLTSVTYPNGQTTTYGYFGLSQDEQLQDIHNKLSGGATLSRFQYTYDAAGAMKSWTQQADGGAAKVYDLGQDAVYQLTTATLRTTDPTPVMLKRYRFGYDKAGNRTTEQIDETILSGTHNSVNQVTGHQPGGSLRFAGTVSEPATVTVQGNPAAVGTDNRFEGQAPVSSGTNTVVVVASDSSGNVRTNNYQLSVSGAAKTFTYDANGNLTGDGMRVFEWDAANRLTAVVQGAQRSEFSYDGWSHRVRVVEKNGGSITSDRRFLWCGTDICEERDATGATVVRRFYGDGVQEGGAALFYTRDHLESVRELTDASGAVRARYDYDPYGRTTKVSGDKDSVFTYTGHVWHSVSGLLLAPMRAYDPSLGRWISPDPIGVAGGLNLYGYVGAQPTDYTDPLGLKGPPPAAPPAGVVATITQALITAGDAIATAGIAVVGVIIILVAQKGDGLPPHDPAGTGGGTGTGTGAGTSTGTGTTTGPGPGPGPGPGVPSPAPSCSPSPSPCPPCKLVDGTIVAVGTIAYRPVENPRKPQHGITGPHHNIYKANQNPNNCQCFWQPIGAVPPPPQPGWIPIQPFAN